jgi:hexosaminidase
MGADKAKEAILMHCSKLAKYFLTITCFLFSVHPLVLHAYETPAALAVIPRPAKIEIRSGAFEIGPNTQIYLNADNADAGWVSQYLSRLLSKPIGHTIPVHVAENAGQYRGAIVLSLKAPATLATEGYELSISRDAIRISAPKVAGLFYGVQTLRQMLPPEIESREPMRRPLKVQGVRIQDSPRFAWRGLMLDCSRTFLSMDYLRHTVDLMALYKLNVLHLHLTDDQGWRLQIRQYPKLTTVGAYYARRFGGGGGFYTQEQMRNLIAYASKRNVTVVPEIEMPGHSAEVLAAYPELACPVPGKKPTFQVVPFWEPSLRHHHTQPLCVCKDNVFEMYRNILSEIIGLFPSEFIHVGGDEVPKEAWNESPLCQAFMKAKGLKDADELQSYFMKRIEKVVAAKGRRMIGWDEILEGGLAPGATVMSWRGTKGGLAAARAGHDVVMAPNPYTYFDYTYDTTPTQKVYSYDPAEGFTPAMAKHILGVEACMWTHIAVTEKANDYQIYPRLLALAEVGWSPEQSREWSGFDHRLTRQFPRLQSLGVTYRDPQAVGTKLGTWSESDLTGDTPRVFNWDATSSVSHEGEIEVQVRWESGQHSFYVPSIELLEDGKQTSRVLFPAPLNKRNDVEVGWLSRGSRHPGSRYTLRATLQGTAEGAASGSVWIMKPSGQSANPVGR